MAQSPHDEKELGASEKRKRSPDARNLAGKEESGVRYARGRQEVAHVQLCGDAVRAPETSLPTLSGYRSLRNWATLYEIRFSHLESNIYLTEFYRFNDTRYMKGSHSPLHLLEVESS